MKALIVEDEILIALSLRDDLHELGYCTVEIVRSVREAVEMAPQVCPDLIVADYRLGDGTGVDAVNLIDGRGDIPTVYACALPEDVLEIRPDAVAIAKPFTLEELKSSIEKARLASAGREQISGGIHRSAAK